MKSDYQSFWLEWGFRLLVLMLLGLWFLVPPAKPSTPVISSPDMREAHHD